MFKNKIKASLRSSFLSWLLLSIISTRCSLADLSHESTSSSHHLVLNSTHSSIQTSVESTTSAHTSLNMSTASHDNSTTTSTVISSVSVASQNETGHFESLKSNNLNRTLDFQSKSKRQRQICN
jgi:hypothetical protein